MTTSPTIERPEGAIEQRFVLGDISWDQYQTIATTLEGRHVRLTYDRGTLEFMTISPLHGHLSRILARMIVVLTEELALPLKSLGNMTCGREDLERSLEPDECFYITNEPEVRGTDQLDLSVDPPPDLAVEIDLTHSPRSRLGIYQALGVPEVWRFHDDRLAFHALNESGEYEASETSLHFPNLKASDLLGFLNRRKETDENTLLRAFREWVRENLAGR